MDEFLSRIQLERQVLEAVNARFGGPSLAGLSPVAVGIWTQADPAARSDAGNQLAKLVQTLSTQLYGRARRAKMIDPEQQRAFEAFIAGLSAR